MARRTCGRAASPETAYVASCAGRGGCRFGRGGRGAPTRWQAAGMARGQAAHRPSHRPPREEETGDARCACGGKRCGAKRRVARRSPHAGRCVELHTDRRPTRQRNLCARDGCETFARRQSAGSTCIAHGGGPRCEEPDCDKSAQGGTRACIAHGGGPRCEEPDCDKSAFGGTRACKKHGGGPRCKYPDCDKSARGDTGACVAHGPRCEFALYDCANGQSRRGAAPTMCIRHGGGLSSDELRERNEQRERQEELRAQQLVQMACGYGAPTTEQKAEAAALFNSMNPRLWPRQAVILAHAIAPDVATPKRQVSHHDLSSSSSPPNQSEEKSTREERSSPKFGFLNFVTDCALHGVSPRDRWLCVLPRWRINVNVSVNFVTNARSLAHRPPARVPWPPSRLSLSRHATCHGGRLSTDLGIAGSAGCAPLRNNGGLAENRLL